MRIKKLLLKNIRSYQSEEIEFPEGSLLLSGDVGSGKTTILLAIEYALFGLQPGQKGSALLRNETELGEVALELEVSGQDILIERKLRRNNKSVNNDYAAITINGEKTESSITEIKTKILQLLSYPVEFIKKNNLLYRFTVYTPQENMKQIVLEDPQTRLNVLRHIFGIEKYKRMRENLTLLINNLKEDSKFLQGEIRSLDEEKTKLGSIKSYVITIKSRIIEKDEILKEKIRQRKAIEQEVQELEKKIKEKESLEKEVEKTNILLSTKSESFPSLNRELKELSTTISEMNEPYSDEEYAGVSIRIEEEKNKLESLNKSYIEVISKINFLDKKEDENLEKKERIFKMSICPTCLQNVHDSHKYNIVNESEKNLAEIKNERVAINDELKTLQNSIAFEKVNLKRLEEQKTNLDILRSRTAIIQKSKQKLEELKKTSSSLEKDIALLTKHSNSLKADILRLSSFANLYRLKQDELKKAFVEEKTAEIDKAELRKESEIMQKEILELEGHIKDKEDLKTKLNNTQDLINWLSTQFLAMIDFTERTIMIKLRGEFSKLFNKWFTMLVPDSAFEVQLDENFTPLIIQGETEMEYAFLSGGERTAVALAYRLALNQTINSVYSEIRTKDLVILDEPTEGFSEAQLDKIRDVLDELNVAQLIIVSHEQKIESFVDNVVRLKKQGDSSFLESNLVF